MTSGAYREGYRQALYDLTMAVGLEALDRQQREQPWSVAEMGSSILEHRERLLRKL